MLKLIGTTALALLLAPTFAMANDAAMLKDGEKVYKQSCIACHSTGAANAPKLGNKKVWEPLIAKGMDSMMDIAINGKGGMPARGGTKADDEAIRAAVEFMLSKVQ